MFKHLGRAAVALAAGVAFGAGAGQAWAQNMKPLERGDFQESTLQIQAVPGLKAKGEFSFWDTRLNDSALTGDEQEVIFGQNFRLELESAVHPDIQMHVTLEPRPADLATATTLRLPPTNNNPKANQGALPESQALTVWAREAYLRYWINPRSGLIFGQQEVSLADRNGKVFDALATGVTFDCKMKTWCIPLGVLKIGPHVGDFIWHMGLTFLGWEEEVGGMTDQFKLEFYRLTYDEKNVPMAANLGPTTVNTSNPAQASASQVASGGNPVFYDAKNTEYFGLRATWDSGPVYLHADVTSQQGIRFYHMATGQTPSWDTTVSYPVQGLASEVDLGWRTQGLKIGLRGMTASGDTQVTGTGAFLRPQFGFHEITPGTYQGARLFFNGAGSQVDAGTGLGHSITNTAQNGIYLEWVGESGRSYSGAVYSLSRPQAVLNTAGLPVNAIGMEWDNRYSVQLHPALRLDFELNAIQKGAAFTYADGDVPLAAGSVGSSSSMYQLLVRAVYKF